MHFAIRNAFIIITNVICNDKVLIQLNILLFFVIKIDVFDFDWKIILYQVNLDEIKRFVVFKNKAFS